MHSPPKKVLYKLEDSYHTYINSYKTHAMATHYGGRGKLSEKDSDPQENDVTIYDEYQEDINNFENVEPDLHERLRDLTHEIDHLWQKVEANESKPMDTISHLECKLNRLALTLCLFTLPEPIEEVLQQYTDTLCTTQKKTSFVNTLLQDIMIFNGNASSQLEDWFIDIETASDLTGESRTKLAQAKSKVLICKLISEALSSNKTWDEIKNTLNLKICNSDIHTSVSHFMEIQQKEKESLAAYIHCFKKEANRCNFNNNTATIWIFIKGLRNAHTLAARVYEKGPQSLADAIREVEKLQAAQQLTAALLPSSTVNIMSSDHDKCFQCQ